MSDNESILTESDQQEIVLSQPIGPWISGSNITPFTYDQSYFHLETNQIAFNSNQFCWFLYDNNIGENWRNIFFTKALI